MSANKAVQILVVDDDAEISQLIGEFLGQYGFDVSMAQDGEEMFRAISKQTPEIIILDLMMPGDDGLTLCKKLRSESNIPVIMLTAMGEETDRIIGLEVGADDYLPKPFNPRELLARIKAILRRTQEANQTKDSVSTNTITFADWKLNLATRRLESPDNVEISISSSEYDLLVALTEHPQHVLSRDQLLEITRNRSAGPFDRSIDVQISRLRYKIESDPKNPHIIKTVRGGGYLFTPEVSRA